MSQRLSYSIQPTPLQAERDRANHNVDPTLEITPGRTSTMTAQRPLQYTKKFKHQRYECWPQGTLHEKDVSGKILSSRRVVLCRSPLGMVSVCQCLQ
jgi:hypothetical protein